MRRRTSRSAPRSRRSPRRAAQRGAVVSATGGRSRSRARRSPIPVAYTLALAAEAERHGAELRLRFRVAARSSAVRRCARPAELRSRCRRWSTAPGSRPTRSPGWWATTRSRSTRARASSWCSSRPPASRSSGSCCRFRPSGPRGCWCSRRSTARIVAGPTAVDLEDKRDWSVRPGGARGDHAQGDRDVPAARGRRADRRVRRAAARGPRGQLRDRALAGVPGSSTSPRSARPA